MPSCSRCGLTYNEGSEFCGLDGAQLVEIESDPLLGRTLDRYRIVEFVAGGGMARVYRAEHAFLGTEFALKILNGNLQTDRAFTERFRREAAAASKIRHPNVVMVSDFGTTAEGVTFMAMEFVRGDPLSAVIGKIGKLSPSEAGAIALQILQGLSAAHKRGYVHRDLKPQNVMLVEPEGFERGLERRQVKILDFGLVRSTAPADPKTALTLAGQVFGTPQYMSPEQITQDPIDHRVDLYSLGVILYEMLVGFPPFTGSATHILAQQLSAKPRKPKASRGLESITLALLEKKPDKRPKSADEVIQKIERLDLEKRSPKDRPSSKPRVDRVVLEEEEDGGWDEVRVAPEPQSVEAIIVTEKVTPPKTGGVSKHPQSEASEPVLESEILKVEPVSAANKRSAPAEAAFADAGTTKPPQAKTLDATQSMPVRARSARSRVRNAIVIGLCCAAAIAAIAVLTRPQEKAQGPEAPSAASSASSEPPSAATPDRAPPASAAQPPAIAPANAAPSAKANAPQSPEPAPSPAAEAAPATATKLAPQIVPRPRLPAGPARAKATTPTRSSKGKARQAEFELEDRPHL
jgi:serine/threonine protein kinase